MRMLWTSKSYRRLEDATNLYTSLVNNLHNCWSTYIDITYELTTVQNWQIVQHISNVDTNYRLVLELENDEELDGFHYV